MTTGLARVFANQKVIGFVLMQRGPFGGPKEYAAVHFEKYPDHPAFTLYGDNLRRYASEDRSAGPQIEALKDLGWEIRDARAVVAMADADPASLPATLNDLPVPLVEPFKLEAADERAHVSISPPLARGTEPAGRRHARRRRGCRAELQEAADGH